MSCNSLNSFHGIFGSLAGEGIVPGWVQLQPVRKLE